MRIMKQKSEDYGAGKRGFSLKAEKLGLWSRQVRILTWSRKLMIVEQKIEDLFLFSFH